MQENLREQKRPKKKGGAKRIVLLTLALLFIVLLGISMYGAGMIAIQVNDVSRRFREVQTAAQINDLDGMIDQFDAIRDDFAQMRKAGALLSWAKIIPFVGGQVRGVQSLASGGHASFEASLEAMRIVHDIRSSLNDEDASVSVFEMDEDARKTLVLAIKNNASRLRLVQTNVRIAQAELGAIDEEKLASPLRAMTERFSGEIDTAMSLLNVAVPMAQSIDIIAGTPEESNWLLLFLNNNELRPGGGFMGVAGYLTMKNGLPTELLVDDPYALDRLVESNPAYAVAAPEPIARYLGTQKWYFRNANWSPDFKTSSEYAVSLLRQEAVAAGVPVPEIDGVFGVTTTFAEHLLDILGPVEVDGMTFTADDAISLLQFETSYGYEGRDIPREERKQIVGALTEEVLMRLLTADFAQWVEIFKVVNEDFHRKYIAVYATQENAQAVFEDYTWAGRLKKRGDDALMVIDANMNALKTDPFVEREVAYSITPQNGALIATAKITYHHTGTFALNTSRYRTYTRIFVPQGSEFISVQGAFEDDAYNDPARTPGSASIGTEGEFAVFGAFTSVEPGEKQELIFTYRLPDSVIQSVKKGFYELQVFKQIGAGNLVLTLDLDFDKKVRSASPAEDVREFGDHAYKLNTKLEYDRVFSLDF